MTIKQMYCHLSICSGVTFNQIKNYVFLIIPYPKYAR